MDSFLMAGLDIKWNKHLSQAFEFLYGFDIDYEGNPKGHPPMLARTGLNYELSDKTSIDAKAYLGKSLQLI